MDTSPSRDTFLDKYLAFCANPLRNAALLTEDLLAIINHEHVQSVCFYQPPEGHELLAITTTMVVAVDPDTDLRHCIGEFLLLVSRVKVERWWEVDFWVCNRSHNPNGPRISELVPPRYQHPHMSERDEEVVHKLGLPVARICISHGQFAIFQSIRRARLFETFLRLNELLHTVEWQGQYDASNIKKWPREDDYYATP